MEDNKSNSLHALLIAIDCYLPNRLPMGGYYPSLGGCVSDINRIENFLTQKIGLLSDNILKLTASNSGKSEPSEPSDKWPTYDNMVKAFNQIIDKAASGDQVCIYYSGHGGRTTTAFPKLKGEDGLDETLVPTDIGNSEARYLRDIEIAHLLKKMVDKGLVVTMILDSCHSGGATRGNVGAATRGISEVDRLKDRQIVWSHPPRNYPKHGRNLMRTPKLATSNLGVDGYHSQDLGDMFFWPHVNQTNQR